MEDDEPASAPDQAFIEPPEVHHDSDDDSGDDDRGGSADNLSGRQPRLVLKQNSVKIGAIAGQRTVTVTTTVNPIHPCLVATASLHSLKCHEQCQVPTCKRPFHSQSR